MVLFSRKYQKSYGSFFPSWLIYAGILMQAGMRVGATVAASAKAFIIDMLLVNSILASGIITRFAYAFMGNPYGQWPLPMGIMVMHLLISACFFITCMVRGVYSKTAYSPRNALVSGVIASTVFLTVIYFTQVMAFSRIAFAGSAVLSSFALVAWREFFARKKYGTGASVYITGKVIVVGDNDVTRQLIKKVEQDSTARIEGIVWPGNSEIPGQFEGYPVLGELANLKEILKSHSAGLLIVATQEPWYSHFIEALSVLRRRHLSVKWVRPEILSKAGKELPHEIPLEDFTV
jgi:FlaA1/EpsC-like NDP-sugar epimerase